MKRFNKTQSQISKRGATNLIVTKLGKFTNLISQQKKRINVHLHQG